MKKLVKGFRWWNRPITWKGSLIATLVLTAISAIIGFILYIVYGVSELKSRNRKLEKEKDDLKWQMKLKEREDEVRDRMKK